MTLPIAVSVLLVDLVLVAAGLLLFLPDPPPLPRRRRDVERLAARYGPWLVPVAVVLIAHVLEVQIDAVVSERLRYDIGSWLAATEAPLRALLPDPGFAALDWAAAAWYVLIHPAVVATAILLFVTTDEERAARAALLAFPLAYAISLPFFLFAPARNLPLVTLEPSPLFDHFPDFASFYYSIATPDNTIPAFHVALAVLVWNAARLSRNRRFRVFTGAHAVVFTLATIHLRIHPLTGIVAALVVAVLAALYVARAVDVERLALKRVKPVPAAAQHIREDGDALVAHVGEVAVRVAPGARPMLVGSVAKDTYLRDAVDFDVFVLFQPAVARDELERAGLAIGRAALDEPIEKYAEHPYVHGRWRRQDADIVPAYALDDASDRMTAVDRTPFHTRYVLDRMAREQRDETRLLKAFLVGVGGYGAESRTRGFSGYLCELLVLKYGSFHAAVRAGARFKPGTFLVVDPVELPQGGARFKDPLVVLDPVDVSRNAASAVSEETLALFADACRAYLPRPGLAFFFPRPLLPLPPERLQLDLRRRRGELLLLRVPRPDALDDHLHDQIRKLSRAAQELLERHNFEVRRVSSELADTEARVLLEVARLKLSEGQVHGGPPLSAAVHADRFRKAWEGNPEALSPVYEEDGRLKVKRRRPWRRADDLVRAELPKADLGKHLGPAARGAFEVVTGPAVVREDTALLLTRHLDRRRPWER
ncbi:MAG TPA: CCA tRNA nucleotidyltransferase [Candidatus Thermoplasmatota archaeon]|nr:CCA tRNA nucleotidyltransferase [Candidatus Thermoplasmatota archaeon]